MIHQGHLYAIHGRKCIALQSGSSAEFWVLKSSPDIADVPRYLVATEDRAKPLPMKYHGGEVPDAED